MPFWLASLATCGQSGRWRAKPSAESNSGEEPINRLGLAILLLSGLLKGSSLQGLVIRIQGGWLWAKIPENGFSGENTEMALSRDPEWDGKSCFFSVSIKAAGFRSWLLWKASSTLGCRCMVVGGGINDRRVVSRSSSSLEWSFAPRSTFRRVGKPCLRREATQYDCADRTQNERRSGWGVFTRVPDGTDGFALWLIGWALRAGSATAGETMRSPAGPAHVDREHRPS